MTDSANTYHLIVTNCTARKRCGQNSLRLNNELVSTDLAGTARQWCSALLAHEPKMPANEMYMGRSMVEAKFVASALNSPLYVASAGLGLVAGSDAVVSYDLTASGPRGGLQEALLLFGATTKQWWDLLCNGKGLACLLAQKPEAIMLLALPANYVEMVAHDLDQITPEAAQRLRLFTSPPGISALPPRLTSIAMPYNDRLESIPNCAGTRADFPQRAMRHFVETLKAHNLSQDSARDAVEDALAPYKPPRPVERKRADDESIKKLIRQQWISAGGRGNTLLRYLRDEALISCEQGRFAQLWHEVRNELTHRTQA